MKNLILVAVLCLFTACSTSENELLTSIAARQAVGRYIAAGDTLEEENRRAQSVIDKLDKVKALIDGNPKATSDQIILTIESNIDWASLEASDRVLVLDIVGFLKSELEAKYKEKEASEKALIAIKALFETAISAAKVYLMR